MKRGYLQMTIDNLDQYGRPLYNIEDYQDPVRRDRGDRKAEVGYLHEFQKSWFSSEGLIWKGRMRKF